MNRGRDSRPDRRRRRREPRRHGDTGEASSLKGQLMRMGDRIVKSKPPSEKERFGKDAGKSKASNSQFFETAVTDASEFKGLQYKPRTQETRAAYEKLLSFVQQRLGDIPRDVLAGAADEVLITLKTDEIRAPEKKAALEELLDKMPSEDFSALCALGREINDFSTQAQADVQYNDTNEASMGDALGVAVVFDDDGSEEEDEAEFVREVKASDDESDYEDGRVDTHTSSGITGALNDDNNEDDEGSALDVDVKEVDAFWVQRKLGTFYSDANESHRLAGEVLSVLGVEDERECENKLVLLLDYDKFDLIKVLLRNRFEIRFCTLLQQAQTDAEKAAVKASMIADESGRGASILQRLESKQSAATWAADREAEMIKKSRREARQLQAFGQSDDSNNMDITSNKSPTKKGKEVDLENLVFKQGSRLLRKRNCELPPNSWRAQKKGYEEVHIPALKAKPMSPNEKLILIDDLPSWSQPAFSGMKKLNRVQSKLYEYAFKNSNNLLLCAPTGAGKTNVAMLTMLHELGKHRKPNGSFDLDKFKIVYVAPMKALVQECVANFGRRLQAFGIQVRELSGDVQLSRRQIMETQVIVTTPEKWDIITRKAGDRTYTQIVRLVIIDEIHLLHDSRGPVLESIVARTLRQVETTEEMIRIVGLSATLPNYEDVAEFLRVDPNEGLFYFDNSFRPCPLQQQYIGVTEKKAIKRFNLMNQICYEKVMESAGQEQVIVFVHSRKETAKTATALRDAAEENETLDLFLKNDSAIREILQTEAETAQSAALKELLPYGFACHHAGMTRSDRSLVEDLFADGSVQVLVSTATLAWGVNLPAHTVIIKGTQIYNPEKGCWTELSYLDIMQMLGRAGRPQYDTHGEGIIITTHTELQYYLSLMNQQLPIESQFIKPLADNLNAEIVMGSVQTIDEAVQWLSYTYLYVRMLRQPDMYGVSDEDIKEDPLLEQRRMDLLHSASALLAKHGLIRYDRKSGTLQSTPLGRVAAHYYISYISIATFNDYLKPNMSEVELFRLFSLSYEFRNIVVRQEEKMELKKLLERVPIPVKEGITEPSAKINVLLQTYIAQLSLTGFALCSDMVYVQQSAGRIMRALFEIALRRGWASLSNKCLDLCKMIDKRMWRAHSPLRQFSDLSLDVIRKIEKKNISWDRYYDLKPHDIGELLRSPKIGKVVYRLVHQFPRIECAAYVQPITRSTIKVELTLTADFQMDPKVHGWGEAFHVMVEDVNGEKLLHHELFLLTHKYAEEDHAISFTVPMYEPLPPQYFVRIVNDRWLHSETLLPISFRHLLLPDKFLPHTELLDLQPLPVSALRDPEYEALFTANISHFNPVQTQVFNTLYESDDNVLLCAPAGSGKITAAEFTIIRLFRSQPTARCVYVAPKSEITQKRYKAWQYKFGDSLKKNVVHLTGETSTDLKLLAGGDIIIATAEQWDMLSRRWKHRKNIQNVALFIVDQLHLVGSQGGPTVEVVVSRMRYIASQTKNKMRIVALSASVANAKDLGNWIGTGSNSLFNFHPNVRPIPLDIHIRGFAVDNFAARMLCMAKPAYNTILRRSPRKPVIVFVPSRRQSQLTAIDIVSFAVASGQGGRFLGPVDASQGNASAELSQTRVNNAVEKTSNSMLSHVLSAGVAFFHSGMTSDDRIIVERLFNAGDIQVVVIEECECWGVNMKAHLVTIMGTTKYDGLEHRYVDYPITSLLQMMGCAGRQNNRIDDSASAAILCHFPKKGYYKQFLYEALPVESHLDRAISDHMNAEVVNKTIENKQDAVDYLTWSFFYRRINRNPNYYNMLGTTHQHISDHVSELVESTVDELVESSCVSCENEMDITPLNLGMISAYYYIKYTSIELFASSLTKGTKLRGILQIISAASEFDNLAVRPGDDKTLWKIAKHLPQKVDFKEGSDNVETPHVKANILLQSHFGRIPLSSELRVDQAAVLGRVVRLLQSMVDVISSNGWLKPALAAMEMTQMVIQARWSWDSPLLQIPHFTKAALQRCDAYNAKLAKEQTQMKTSSDDEEDGPIESVFDILELDDDVRENILQVTQSQMNDVARFCNAYPAVELEFEVQDEDEICTGGVVEVVVNIQRDDDDDDDDDDEPTPKANVGISKVVCPSYPGEKTEGWWLVVGNVKDNALLSIKRVAFAQKHSCRLEFAAPEKPGKFELVMYLMSDCYIRCDQEFKFNINVLEGDSSSEDED